MRTSINTIRWVESLAEQELLIQGGARSSFDVGATKHEVLLLETVAYLQELFHQFQYLTRLFNASLVDSPHSVKLARTESLESFFLSRNQMKLAFSRPIPGAIQVSCEKLNPHDIQRTQRPSVMFSGLIEGKFGNFYEVDWFFLGSRITSEQVVRHYLTEFLQASR